jgi:KRAB domain-containing zinc finger protein
MENSIIKQEQSVEFVLILPAREVKKVEVKREIDDELECKICDKIFETKKKLKNHQRDIHKPKVECSICLKMILPINLKKHMKTHDLNRKRNFKCEICFKVFATKDILNQHLKSHNKSFKCEKCDKKFAFKHQFEAHKLAHIEQNPLKCDLCPKTYVQKASLFTHMKENHISDSKLFKCSKCDKKFLYSSLLKTHMATHEQVKAFKCNQCDYAGKTNGNLKKHIKLNHLIMKSKCQICEKSFGTKEKLKLHQKYHKEKVECSICSKMIRPVKLKQHMKIHDN